MDDHSSFAYTYSAKDQAEIKRIREKYTTPEEPAIDKMEQLRRLDAGVTQKGSVASLILGILGALILGFGMSLVMTELGSALGLGTATMPLGIVIGLIGMIAVALAYPLYTHITKKERERIAPEILRLTDELMK